MTWNLPNILTTLRLLTAPAILVVFAILPRPWSDWTALLLFGGAAVTDWFDGYLARKLNQQTRFGAMLDSIADKVIIVISIATLLGLFGPLWWLAIPAAAIFLREVFVSGLREYLGDRSHHLSVTWLAKWKTTLQMIAIATLFLPGIISHALIERSIGMGPEMTEAVLRGQASDVVGLENLETLWNISIAAGAFFLWVAMALTLYTGYDYLRKALPLIKEGSRD